MENIIRIEQMGVCTGCGACSGCKHIQFELWSSQIGLEAVTTS